MQAKCFFYHLLRTTRISLAPGLCAALADVADPEASGRAFDPVRAGGVKPIGRGAHRPGTAGRRPDGFPLAAPEVVKTVHYCV